MTPGKLSILWGAAVFGASLWRTRRKATPINPVAGWTIGDAPDPGADYLPENRPISAEHAAELRRMLRGES